MRRGRPIVIAWQDEAAALYARYQQERKPDLRPRWHALWLVRTGRTGRETARVLGVHERSVQQWLAWYRQGGTAEVARHRKAGKGPRARLSGEQQVALLAEAATGRFRTAAAVVARVEEQFGAVYTVSGMHQVLRRLRCHPKVPRPLAEKADLAAQDAWKKGGVVTPSMRPA
jgi:transposase